MIIKKYIFLQTPFIAKKAKGVFLQDKANEK